jgi:hypothetical protein
MNEENIEDLLRKAPAGKTPPGLAERLKTDLKLPHAARDDGGFQTQSWLRRWLPALAPGAFLIACLVAAGVQSNIISGLKSDNGRLRSSTQNLEQLRADNQDYQQLQAQGQDLDRLRQENADLLRLRQEMTQLQAAAQEAAQLRAANQALTAQMQSTPSAGTGGDFFADARDKAENVNCINNLKLIGIAARTWAGDNNGFLPSNFACMTNVISIWQIGQILKCPGDHSLPAGTMFSWADVQAGKVSYTMVSPGIEDTFPNAVFVYCPIHHNYLLVDGSVQRFSPEAAEKYIKVIDGKMQMVSPRQ